MSENLIKYWDDKICEVHIMNEVSRVIGYFKSKNIEEISYIDIGANVGKFYDKLSQNFKIKNSVMYEGSKTLFEYLEKKFNGVNGVEVYNYAISNKNGTAYFNEDSLRHHLNQNNPNTMNLGLSHVSNHKGYEIEMRNIFDLLSERKEFFYDFDFIKIDTENLDYLILESLIEFIKKMNKIPFICFEHNYHTTIDSIKAKEIYEHFLSECHYDGPKFEDLGGDICLIPKSK